MGAGALPSVAREPEEGADAAQQSGGTVTADGDVARLLDVVVARRATGGGRAGDGAARVRATGAVEVGRARIPDQMEHDPGRERRGAAGGQARRQLVAAA